ncbi:carboxymuconolactone decarboxylase family protein [Nocardia sp. KC 131]|jgi:AhpD family alkylhydroperoxidase|uniref:carboxymuconolactone decarboxylase family protein n=1 Tax=Nocardia arseniciresistens TaxID=3392119 RepID=UPI00398F020F
MNLAEVAPEMYHAWFAAESAIRRSALDPTIRELVKIRASQINGCVYCIDMHTTDARLAGETEKRIFQLGAWRESTLYTAQERAALAYTDALTKLGQEGVSDEIWAEVEKQFEQGARAGLVGVAAMINLWNRVAIPLRMQPEKL